MSSEGDYLKLSGLTIRRNDEITRGEHISRGWLKYVPAKIGESFFLNRFGEGQSEARRSGFKEGERIAGASKEMPSLIHPGEVSGSSTGLAWGLAYIGNKYPKFLSYNVAVTGTLVYGVGIVVGVAGIEDKLRSVEVADADIVFVPHRQRGAAEDVVINDLGFEGAPVVVGVRSIDEAVGVLCVLNGDFIAFCREYLSSFENGLVTLGSENVGLCSSLRRSFNGKYMCRYAEKGDEVLLSR
ncbi:MAG: hypothetical protein ACKOW9_02260 [Candidatus Paceibacterota bacterium]